MINKSLCRNWGWLTALGIAFVILGSIAIMLPYITTISAVLALGIILGIAGVFQFIQAYKETLTKRKFLHILLGVLALGVGLFFFFRPAESALSLTLILSAFLVATGIFRIIYSLSVEHKYWVLLLISGIISILLGGLIYYQWPASGLFIIGLFVGIDLIFNGWSLIFISWNVHKACTEK